MIVYFCNFQRIYFDLQLRNYTAYHYTDMTQNISNSLVSFNNKKDPKIKFSEQGLNFRKYLSVSALSDPLKKSVEILSPRNELFVVFC